MYAIIETGGKQYRIEEGDVIQVEKLPYEAGSEVIFDRVLMYCRNGQLMVGHPYLEGCRVEGKLLRQGRARKIIVFKYKAKKNYRRKRGHRQPFSEVRIDSIVRRILQDKEAVFNEDTTDNGDMADNGYTIESKPTSGLGQ